MVDSVSRRAKPVHLSRKVVWVGSERALSEVEGVRLMVSVKVGRLPSLPETLSSTAMPRTLSQNGYAHDFDCDHFKYQCSGDSEGDSRELLQRSKESTARLSHKSGMDRGLCIAV